MSESKPPEDVTQLLLAWQSGSQAALDELLPHVYDELRRLSSSYLRRERSNHTLQSTALVHEAYMKPIDQKQVHWQNRAHFFAIAAQVIRRILVAHARGVNAQKRGAGAYRLSIEDAPDIANPASGVDLSSLDQAMERLATFDTQQAKIAQMRFCNGLSIEETAEA